MGSYLYKINLRDACNLLRFTQALIMHDTRIRVRFAFLFPDLLHLETTTKTHLDKPGYEYRVDVLLHDDPTHPPLFYNGEVEGSGL